MKLFSLLTHLAPLAMLTPLAAQTVYTVEPVAAGGAVVREIGFPNWVCGMNVQPVIVSQFAAVPLTNCQPNIALAGATDIAYDSTTDLVWVTDGKRYIAYGSSAPTLGVAIDGFDIATNPIAGFGVATGMAIDGASSTMALTDGANVLLLSLPNSLLAPCGGVPPILVGPNPISFGAGYVDLDFDPTPGAAAIVALDAFGVVAHLNINGVVSAQIPSAPPCAFGPVFTVFDGIAIDRAATAATSGSMFIANRAGQGGVGSAIGYYDNAGAQPAALQPYWPTQCAAMMNATEGLAFAPHALPYGTGGTNSATLPIPAIGSNYAACTQTSAGAQIFEATILGTPGAFIYLYLDAAPSCPPVVVNGLVSHVTPGGAALIGAGQLTAGPLGAFQFSGAYAIPPTAPPGYTFYLQWLEFFNGNYATSPGLAVTIAVP